MKSLVSLTTIRVYNICICILGLVMRLAKKKIIWASVGSPRNGYKYERRGDCRSIERHACGRPIWRRSERRFFWNRFFFPISTTSVLHLNLSPSSQLQTSNANCSPEEKSGFSNSSITRISVYSVRGFFSGTLRKNVFFA